MLTAIKIRKKYEDKLDVAVKYYSIISVLNDFKWTTMEINLIAYIAVKGSINAGGAKEAFIKKFGSTKVAIQQLSSRLKIKGFLVKEGNKVLLHKALQIAVSETLLIQLNIGQE